MLYRAANEDDMLCKKGVVTAVSLFTFFTNDTDTADDPYLSENIDKSAQLKILEIEPGG